MQGTMERTQAETLSQVSDDFFAGFARSAQPDTPRLRDRFMQVTRLLTNEDRYPGPIHHAAMYQAMTSADFPQLTGTILERRLAAEYAEYPTDIEGKFLRTPRMDFNLDDTIEFYGTDFMMERVPTGGEYTNAHFAESNRQYKLAKWGRKAPLAWEMLKNDRLGAFNRIPSLLAKGARMTVDRYLTGVFWTTTGARTTLIDATDGSQTAVSSLPLTPANLGTAIGQMGLFTRQGAPTWSQPRTLEVPPALHQTAIEMLESRTLAVIATGLKATNAGTVERFSDSNAYIRNLNLRVVVNPWIPLVVTDGTKGATCWALYCDPGDIPAGEMGVLMGEESPTVWVKTGNQQRVGGGADGMNMSFETDSVEYKVRHVFEAVETMRHGRWHSNGQ